MFLFDWQKCFNKSSLDFQHSNGTWCKTRNKTANIVGGNGHALEIASFSVNKGKKAFYSAVSWDLGFRGGGKCHKFPAKLFLNYVKRARGHFMLVGSETSRSENGIKHIHAWVNVTYVHSKGMY